MLLPLANTWDTAVLPTATRTMVGTAVITVMAVTIATAAIVTAVGVIRIATVILMAAMAANVTVIGAGALLLVVTRRIIAGARVTPEALLGAVAQLVRQGTTTAPPKAPAGNLLFILCLRGASWASLVSGRTLWRDKVEVLQTRKVSVSKSNHRVVPKFAFISLRTTIVRKVSS